VAEAGTANGLATKAATTEEEAASVLQAVVRGKAVRTELAEQHAAATMVQASARGALARQSEAKKAEAVAAEQAARGLVANGGVGAEHEPVVVKMRVVDAAGGAKALLDIGFNAPNGSFQPAANLPAREDDKPWCTIA